jgi:uncharacterized protein
MNPIDKKIIRFIKKHHVLTLATAINNEPWCCNCFYAYLEDENTLVFTSDDETRHIHEVKTNNFVAGSIVLETNVVGRIKGLQFQGMLVKAEGTRLKKAQTSYLMRFPYAVLMKTNLWCLDISLLKYTDNSLGFGKKLIWKKTD